MKHVDPDADHAPFLLLSIRAEGEAADDEYRAVLRFGGLDERGLHRIRLTHRALGSIDLAEWSGIILGGGPYNVSDPPESKSPTQQRVESELTALIGRVVQRDFPFLGCCYGVGTLGSVVGATIDRTHSEPVGGVTVSAHSGRPRRPPVHGCSRDFRRLRRPQGSSHRTPRPCREPRVVGRTAPSRHSAWATTSTQPSSTPNWISTASAPESTSTRITATSRRMTAESLKSAARQRNAEHPPRILASVRRAVRATRCDLRSR